MQEMWKGYPDLIEATIFTDEKAADAYRRGSLWVLLDMVKVGMLRLNANR
jgi:hypothetical protein